MEYGRRCDFHLHTFYSDGVLSPIELARRAFVMNHEVIALTDHADYTNLEHILESQLRIKGQVSWDVRVLVGVELTHLPADKIGRLASEAKRLGAEIVVVHGESISEPVEPGTNKAAVSCSSVDLLAHPGLITLEEAKLAEKNNVYLELSARKGHCLTNGHVARIAGEAGADLLVNTDSHTPGDLITQEMAYKIALGSGLSEKDALKVVKDNPQKFMKRLR